MTVSAQWLFHSEYETENYILNKVKVYYMTKYFTIIVFYDLKITYNVGDLFKEHDDV